MTRLFTEGYELGTTSSMTWKNGGVSASTVQKRSGAYSVLHRDWLQAGWGGMYKTITASGEIYLRTAIWYNMLGADTKRDIILFQKGGTTLASIGFDETNSKYTVKVNGAVVATGTAPLTTQRWVLLEVHVKIADSGGAIELKVDGIIDISYVGDTKPGADTTIDRVYWNCNNAAVLDSSLAYFDDIAINDTNGTEDNTWCGDGHIIYLKPDSAGDATELTPSAGDNYAAVDEVPSDSDTTYVEGGTVDTRDLYNLAASGLAAGSTILNVVPVAAAKDTVANGGKVALGVKTNDNEYFGSDIALTTAYSDQYGTSYKVNPNTGVAWTISELDALQVGVKVRGT